MLLKKKSAVHFLFLFPKYSIFEGKLVSPIICTSFLNLLLIKLAYIFSLCENIDKLETRCEELQRLLEEARLMLEKQAQIQKRRRERRKSSNHRLDANSHSDVNDEPSIDAIEVTDHHDSSERRTNPCAKDSSDTESSEGRTGSRTQESGYSSAASRLHRFPDSDSEMSSPDRERPPKSSDMSLEEEILAVDRLKVKSRIKIAGIREKTFLIFSKWRIFLGK